MRAAKPQGPSSHSINLALLAIFVTILSNVIMYRIYKDYLRNAVPESGPCPMPKGTYSLTCANLSSEPLSYDSAKCNFTAICDTGKGKKFGVDAKNSYAYGQYGDTCPQAPMIRHEFFMPAFTNYKDFTNNNGHIEAPQRDELQETKISYVNDEDCKIRLQLNAGENPRSLAALPGIAAAVLGLRLIV